MKKQDRFERMLERHNGDEDDWRAEFIPAQHVLDLLRREHAWMRRMVEQYRKECMYQMSAVKRKGYIVPEYCWQARAAQCELILAKLDKRKR